MIFGGKDGIQAQWLCWVACGKKRGDGGPWFGRDRGKPEQGGSFLKRRGGEGKGRIGRCAPAEMKGGDKDVPWKPVAVEGGRDKVVLSRWKIARTTTVVGGFDEKRRDLNKTTGFATWAGRGHSDCQANNAIVASAYGWGLPPGCTVVEARHMNWEGVGRCRGSLSVCTGIYSGVCRPRNRCPRREIKVELQRLSASELCVHA